MLNKKMTEKAKREGSLTQFGAGKKSLTVVDALVVGITQVCAALLPGLSRSGSTLAAGQMRGVNRQTALDFTFVMAIPSILGLINNKKDEISDAMNEIIYSATQLYMQDNNYSKTNGNVYCIKLEKLVDKNYLNNPLIDPVTNNEIDLSKYCKVSIDDKINYSITDECVEIIN